MNVATATEYQQRNLVSNHAYKVTKYIQEVHQQMIKFNLFRTIRDMQPDSVSTAQLNDIDRLWVRIRLEAEAKLKKQHKDWWHAEIPVWKENLRRCNNTIKTLKKSKSTSQIELVNALTTKYKIVKKFRDQTSQSFQLRHQIIQQEIKILQKEKPKNHKKIKHLKHLLRTEKTRELYKKIKEKTTINTQQAPYLQIPTENKKYDTITDLDQIASHIASHNHIHFAQASTTPLSQYKYISRIAPGHPSFDDNIEWSEEQVNTNKHLYQNTTSRLTPLIQTFAHQITTPPPETTTDSISQEDWVKKIRKWKERTTTSPSGIHLGHYKSLISAHKFSFDDQNPKQLELNQQQSEILEAYLKFMNIILSSSTALDRWKVVHSVALFKDTTNHYVHRIRNIHIYEADYNLLLKLKWEQAIGIAEKHHMLHSSQHGSRKHRRSIDPITFEIMQQEISKHSNVPYIQINYDAQACYDRIIPNIAFTISRKYGVHPNILNLVKNTMEQSKYYIKIGSHVATNFYSSTEHNKIFGTGQGSGCSPHIWTMLSSELLSLYCNDAKGFHISDPYQQQEDVLYASAYVDDINTHHSFSHNNTIKTMLCTSQTSAQKWSDILFISGGKLSSTKCNFYAVQWQHATTGRTTINTTEYPTITIEDQEGGFITITNVKTNQHHKSLGYFQSAEKSRKVQELVLHIKHNHLANTINAAGMDFKEVQTYYQTIHSPRIQYITQMSSMQTKATKRIERQATEIALQRMGYSSKTPHGIVYGHTNYGGLDMIDVYMLQGAQNLVNFTRSMSVDHETHNAMKIAYLWWRFSDGRGQCPFQGTPSSYNISDSIWFTELKNFIQQHKLRITMDNIMYPLLRQNDKYIMDLVHRQSYSNKIVSNINQCRLYLHVITLSDIVTIDGRYIELETYQHGAAKPMRIKHNHQYNSSKPNKSVWSYWQSFLQCLTSHKSQRLLHSLGDWIVHSKNIRRQYNTYRDENYVYIRSTQSISKIHLKDKTEERTQTLPSNAIPCKQTMMGIIPRNFIGIPTHSHKKVQTADQQSDILPKEILIATDASVHKGKSAIAWIVTTIDGKVIRRSQQSLIETHISSFRAEAFGVLSALKSLHQGITQQHASWTLYCDNKALIHRLNAIARAPVNIEWTDSDILIAIKHLTPDNGSFVHVKGHTKITANSSIPEKLNHIVDRNANDAINDIPQPIHFSGAIRIFGATTQLFSVRDIVHYCRTNVSQQYWLKRLGQNTFDLIDWEVYQRICIAQKQYNSIKKMLAGITPTQQRLNKLDIRESPLCPLCNETNENIHHVLICKNNHERIQNYKTDIAKTIKQYFKTQDSVFDIINWFIGTNDTEDHQHFQYQNITGWNQLIQGKFTTTIHDRIQSELKLPSNTTKVLTQLGTSITTRWRKAWLNRIRMVASKENQSTSQQQHQSNLVKLEFLYSNRETLSTDNNQFMFSHITQHKQQSQSQIDTWITLHYNSMIRQIKSTAKQIPDQNDIYSSRISLNPV